MSLACFLVLREFCRGRMCQSRHGLCDSLLVWSLISRDSLSLVSLSQVPVTVMYLTAALAYRENG